MTEEYGHISDAFDNLPEEELLMTDQQPITPPPEIVQEWIAEAPPQDYDCIAEQAAQWGADQELEACCEWLAIHFAGVEKIFRAHRRPKPPSLKEQALKAAHIKVNPEGKNGSLIIRALELLPDE